MRRAILALALLAAPMPLAGCGTLLGAEPQLTLTKSLLGVEGLFNAAAQAELDAKAGGFLTGADADRADKARHDAYAGLVVAEAAYKAGRSPDIASVTELIQQLQILTPKRP